MSNEEQQATTPFLTEVIEFLRPRIVEERRNDILKMAVDWTVSEFRTYGRNNNTDDVSVEVELHKCFANVPVEGVMQKIYGYQLLIKITGSEPQHETKECDCFFVMQGEHDERIVNLYMPGERPDGTDGTALQ